ncbi:MAG: tRNA (guanine(26)-N(2))-dimethyltransferase [Candidatus Woesearchaeota archaeon]
MDLMIEGKAKFYASRDKSGKISKELQVFYNPIMKFNRDVSVLLLNNSGMKDMQVADIMAGSGVRGIRFLLELKKGIMKNILVNDYDKNFVSTFNKNLKINNIKKSKNILVSCEDANLLILKSKGLDYIEIDPFGSPNDFLESSIVRLSRDGILAVTATDTAPLSGTFPAACERNYWAKPLHNSLMHEVGLRILIRKIQLVGAQHDKALIPIYGYFKDHYNRLFFKCIKSKNEADRLIRQHNYILYCNKCITSKVSEYNLGSCDRCKSQMIYAGPIWTGRIYSEKLAGMISKSNKDPANEKFLSIIMQESKSDIVGFYDIHVLCKRYKKGIPNFDMLIDKIASQGYFVSRTHFTPLGIRTNIPLEELIRAIESCSVSLIRS